MNEMKKMDIFVGIRAEQSLRDALRKLTENAKTELELTPVGRKDWVAGQRFGGSVEFTGIQKMVEEVHAKLLALRSEQRIRQESLRFYVVQEPVPVFRDPVNEEAGLSKKSLKSPDSQKDDDSDEGEDSSDDSSCAMRCPVCNRMVHSYNLHYNSEGRIVGCFMCGGNSGFF